MTAPVLYCTLADVLALVSLDAQARLATDAQVPSPIGLGDGVKTVFNTPFVNSSVLTATVGGSPVGITVSPGTGVDAYGNAVDQIVFGSAPGNGLLVACSATTTAVNTAVIMQCVVLATNKVKGSLARYGTEAFSADALAVLQPITAFYARWYLRARRSMNEYDPIIEEYKANNAWLMKVAMGDIALPASAPIAVATLPDEPHTINAEPPVFDPPGWDSRFGSNSGPFR